MTDPYVAGCSSARRGGWRRSDRGSASILAVAIGLSVLFAGSSLALSFAFLIPRAEARSAADLAALAGARWTRAGKNVACARAADIASANHAVMVSCFVEILDIELTVEVKGIRAVARAGPAREAGGSDAA
jgi:secretion/DNA translocation related TadE-like protein